MGERPPPIGAPSSVRIEPLHHHPAWIARIAAQLHAEWREFPAWASLATIEQRLTRHAQVDQAPFALIALDERGERFLGTASVKLFELPGHPDKVHWLGEVFVPDQARGRGMGTALTQACIDTSRRLALPALYLYTPDQQALYARLGWETVEEAEVDGEAVSIMRQVL